MTDLRQRLSRMLFDGQANYALAEFAQFLRDRSNRKQARALDVEQTIKEMMGEAAG